jgi:hypothetical protein
MYEHTLKRGTVEDEIAVSSGDEFLDVLTRHQRDAEHAAEKAGAVAREADEGHARANERLIAIRAAVEAYSEASRNRLARKYDGDR